MDKGRIVKNIRFHGLNPENLIKIEGKSIFVEEDKVVYKLDGLEKTVVMTEIVTTEDTEIEETKQKISDLIEEYKEDIEWDETVPEVIEEDVVKTENKPDVFDGFEERNITVENNIVFENGVSTNMTLVDYTSSLTSQVLGDDWEPVAGDNVGLLDRENEEKLKRLKAIKKPRGWAFRKVFTDSEGNVYHYGKLQ